MRVACLKPALFSVHCRSVTSRTFRAQSRLARWVVVLLLAISAPAVQDALTDLTMWVTGQTCCTDDCDETGSPCSQQCAHCACSGVRNATLAAVASEVPAFALSEAITESGLTPPSNTTLDPPFRPPVS